MKATHENKAIGTGHRCVIARVDPNGPAYGKDERAGCTVVLSRYLFGDGLHDLRIGSVVEYEVESVYGGQRTAGKILSVS
jgi:hypothetical protein